MSEKEKDFEVEEEIKETEEIAEEKEESFEDIFSSLREKYNLQPFGSDEQPVQQEEKVFYNPEEDSEIEDFFKSREDDYTALYEEVDAKLAGVDDEVLKKEAEVFNLEFRKEKGENAPEQEMEFEDIYSQSGEAEDEYEDIYSNSTDEEDDEENYPADIPISVPVKEEKDEPVSIDATYVAAEDEQENITPEEEQYDVEEVTSYSDDTQADNDDAETVVPYVEKTPENFENFDETKAKKKKKSGIFPKKTDSIGEVIRKIVFIISILALLGSAGWLVNDYVIQPYLISRENNEIAEIIAPADAKPEEVVEVLNNLDEEEKTVAFDSLAEINPDFKALIVMPGANINLPVVQCKNNSKYLNTGFKGKWSPGGTAFIDYQNNLPFSDRNTIIYGHNMRDGSMFGSIKNYKDINTFKKNPHIYIYTENGNYVYKIFSVFLTNANPADDCGYVFGYTFKNLSTEENFAGFMEDARLRSYYNTGVDYVEGDRILTLSTCDRTVIKDGRLVVVARLVRENEDEEVDTNLAAVNENQRFPDAWYVKKNKKNPYKDTVRWVAQ